MTYLRDHLPFLERSQPCPERPPDVHLDVVPLKHRGSKPFLGPKEGDVFERPLRRALKRLSSENGFHESLLKPFLDDLLNHLTRARCVGVPVAPALNPQASPRPHGGSI
jgi:hypothetical protein